MERQKHERFQSANQELRTFLIRVDGLVAGTCSITEKDLQSLSQRMSSVAPEVGDASRGETLDAGLQSEIAEYVKNLRALQTALEKIRCFMLAHKLEIESDRRHLEGLHGWVTAYHQTTN
jgi:predicted  nucleic acid-binding Zn-ribbon protein